MYFLLFVLEFVQPNSIYLSWLPEFKAIILYKSEMMMLHCICYVTTWDKRVIKL